MGTEVRIELDERGRTIGETVWAAQLEDGSLLGAAWEWVEAAAGVPALRDPNGFVSNVRLVDDDGAEFNELQHIVGLNRIAHATAWQDSVLQVVGATRSGAAMGLATDALDWSRALHRIDAVSGTGKVAPHRARAVPANALMRPRDLVA